MKRILVAGVGNIFLGDDAFGVEVVARLRGRALPEGVELRDFGLRALDLAYALETAGAAILIDAMPRGGAPGTVYVVEPEPGRAAVFDPHGLTADRALSAAAMARPGFLRVVGCEPGELEEPGLSPPVEAAIEVAIAAVEDLLVEARESLA